LPAWKILPAKPKCTHGPKPRPKLVFMTVVSSGNASNTSNTAATSAKAATTIAPGIPWLSNAIYLMLRN